MFYVLYMQAELLEAKQSWGTDWIKIYRSGTLSLQGIWTSYLPLTQSYLYVFLSFPPCYLEASSHSGNLQDHLCFMVTHFQISSRNEIFPQYFALVHDLMSAIFSRVSWVFQVMINAVDVYRSMNHSISGTVNNPKCFNNTQISFLSHQHWKMFLSTE